MGICVQGRIFYGMVTISEKGQIAVPVEIRRDLGLRTGDQLLVVKRRDNVGMILLKREVMDELMAKIQDDDRFFNKIRKEKKNYSPS
jgi:AbrB family looped-hinge helix DNA binding protein